MSETITREEGVIITFKSVDERPGDYGPYYLAKDTKNKHYISKPKIEAGKTYKCNIQITTNDKGPNYKIKKAEAVIETAPTVPAPAPEQPKAAEQPRPAPVSDKVWEDKDRRIVRQNALGHAVEIMKEIYTEADSMTGQPFVQRVKEIAAELEAWVYREDVKPVVDDHPGEW